MSGAVGTVLRKGTKCSIGAVTNRKRSHSLAHKKAIHSAAFRERCILKLKKVHFWKKVGEFENMVAAVRLEPRKSNEALGKSSFIARSAGKIITRRLVPNIQRPVFGARANVVLHSLRWLERHRNEKRISLKAKARLMRRDRRIYGLA